MKATTTLVVIKLIHTAAWGFLAGCVVLLPVVAYAGRFQLAAVLMAIVGLETAVLAANRWRCPLTDMAAHYTTDRRDNFDIYLPLWLARYNKRIFGTLFLLGLCYTIARWW